MVNQTPENDPSRWNPTWGNQPFPAPNPIEYPNQQYPGQENFQQPQWNPGSNNTMSTPYNPASYPAPAQNQAYPAPAGYYGYPAPSQPNMVPSAYPTTPLGEWNYPQTQGVKQKKGSGKVLKILSRLLAFLSLLGAGLTILTLLNALWFTGHITDNGSSYTVDIKMISLDQPNMIPGYGGQPFIPWTFLGIAIVIAIISLLWAFTARVQFWASITALLSFITTSLSVVGVLDPISLFTDFSYHSDQFVANSGAQSAVIGSATSLICSIIGIIGKARTRK